MVQCALRSYQPPSELGYNAPKYELCNISPNVLLHMPHDCIVIEHQRDGQSNGYIVRACLMVKGRESCRFDIRLLNTFL